MEQHPVPQNVTTFQFRLIGDMTIKQFGYLAGGAGLGYICYKLPLPIFFSLPLAIGVFLLGFGMAFIPVEERPMDIWVLSFIKSIYSPTLYVWKREKQKSSDLKIQSPSHNPVEEKPQIIQTTSEQILPEADIAAQIQPDRNQTETNQQPQPIDTKKSLSLFDSFVAWLFPKPQPKQSLPQSFGDIPNTQNNQNQTDILSGVFAHRAKQHKEEQEKHDQISPSEPDPLFANLQMPTITGNHTQNQGLPPTAIKQEETAEDTATQHEIEALSNKNRDLETRLADLAKKLNEKTSSESRIIELQKQLTEILSERQKMENEVITLRSKIAEHHAATQSPTQPAGTVEERRGPTIRVITPETAINAGLPKLTTFPNVLTGIIKDDEGTLLPGVLVTARDKDGVPLRALKTNKLGQFAASTPLPNATYFVEVEDPRNRFIFDRIQITLNGSIVPAIEVVAKSKKQIEREKLEKQIFGSQQF